LNLPPKFGVGFVGGRQIHWRGGLILSFRASPMCVFVHFGKVFGQIVVFVHFINHKIQIIRRKAALSLRSRVGFFPSEMENKSRFKPASNAGKVRAKYQLF
jgi:hypothetical protein